MNSLTAAESQATISLRCGLGGVTTAAGLWRTKTPLDGVFEGLAEYSVTVEYGTGAQARVEHVLIG
jgi:hypothetical protein